MAYNIVGADGDIIGGDEALAEMLVGYAENGQMPVEYVLGAVAPLTQRINMTQRGRALAPRISNLASRINPAALSRLMGGGAQLQPQGAPAPQGLREVVQGLDSGAVAIAAGASFTIAFNATMTFRPSRLMVGPSFAPNFVIDDIKVAADSLFLSTGAVPAEAFLPDAVTASALKRRTAQAGTPIVIIGTNIDGAAHRFRGALFGEAYDQSSC